LHKNRSAKEIRSGGIPNTYVPARNTIFLSYALGFAEIFEAQEIYIGSNSMDHAPYPDCRPEYFAAFQKLFSLATKQAVSSNPPRLVAPLLFWNKQDIVQHGLRLNVPLDLTLSCYDPTPEGQHCHCCDACMLRFTTLNMFLT